ncbi:phenylacetate-CoA oxygenase subunit PaaJ [Streptomyces sp. M10(2022)]
MIGLGDLGVVRSVAPAADGILEVEITPTFLGCPALPAIVSAVRDVLACSGHPEGRVRQVLSPPWTTDRVTEAGRESSPPTASPAPPASADGPVPVVLAAVPCPHCGSGPPGRTALRPGPLPVRAAVHGVP